MSTQKKQKVIKSNIFWQYSTHFCTRLHCFCHAFSALCSSPKLCFGRKMLINTKYAALIHKTEIVFQASPLHLAARAHALAVLIPLLSLPRQKSDPRLGAACRGGERGIRTLVGVLAQTRFPVVRLRPAQPTLHAATCISYQKADGLSRGF